MRTGLRHHLEPRLVDHVQQVLGVDGEGVCGRQHLPLVVLLQAGGQRGGTRGFRERVIGR